MSLFGTDDSDAIKKMGINFLIIGGVLVALIYVSIYIADM